MESGKRKMETGKWKMEAAIFYFLFSVSGNWKQPFSIFYFLFSIFCFRVPVAAPRTRVEAITDNVNVRTSSIR